MWSRPQPRQAPIVAEGLPAVPRGAVPAELRRRTPGRSGRRRRSFGAGRDRGRASPRPSGLEASRRGPAPREGSAPPSGWPAAGCPRASRRPARTAAADFAPQPGRPGKPSDESPTSASQSGIDAGATPHFARTPASSYVEPTPAIPQDDRANRETSWAMSLSGVQTTIRSTAGSAANRSAAAAIASSASHSTIGQRTSPSASIAASAIGNWARSSGGMPALDL